MAKQRRIRVYKGRTEAMAIREMDLQYEVNKDDIILGNNVCIKDRNNRLIPIYFSNPRYFQYETKSIQAIEIENESFLKECAVYLNNHSIPESLLQAIYHCFNYEDEILYKMDMITIPIVKENSNSENSESQLRIVLTTDMGKGVTLEKDLNSILLKCNLAGKYKTLTKQKEESIGITSETIRTYPFHTVYQYRKQDKEFITINSFRYSEITYSDNKVRTYLKIRGFTTTNDNNVQKILADKLSNFEPFEFEE
jgi:hypothetical protein